MNNFKYIFLWLTFLWSHSLWSQSVWQITGTYQNQPIIDVFEDWEAQSEMRFFYQSSWLDSIYVDGEFDETPLCEALETVLKPTVLNYYFLDDKVIITNNVLIIDQPSILSFFDQDNEQKSTATKGLVFTREYLNQTSDQSDKENYVFEIGNRSDLNPSGQTTLAGYVKSTENEEPVVGALIYTEQPFKATTTDGSGFYSINLPAGKNKLYFQFVGMKSTERNVVMFSDGRLDVDLMVDIIALQEVTIESDRDENIKDVTMGVSKINVEEVKTVPIVLGESDILKVATTKAGVQTVGEGASGFNVRGGKADQNLMLINGAPVYNTSHFFGFFSVFNADAIASMDLYKSGIPAEYGGRLSSIFSIHSKEANKSEFKGQGGISPITSRLTLEVPLIKDKTSLLVGARTTYSNWILKQAKNAAYSENKVSFFDVITRVDHEIDDKNDLVFSSYISRDKFRLSSDTLFSFSDFSYLNFNGNLIWKHQFSGKFNGNFSAFMARYGYDLSYDESLKHAFVQDFSVLESAAKADMEYYHTEEQKVLFGLQLKHYEINPGTKKPLGNESVVIPTGVPKDRGLETSLYGSYTYEPNSEWSLYGGMRYVVFNALGPADIYQYTNGLPKNGATIIDSLSYSSGQFIKTYHGPEWRFRGRYTLDNASSVKIGISRTRQYIHTMSNSASLSPTDTWRLSSPHLKPQVADEASIGYYRNFRQGTIEISVESYYKKLQNLVDFKSGATFLLNDNIEQVVLQGPGKSYGVEFSINKSGKLNGWINYSYARTFIQLDGNYAEETVNEGQFFPTSYDKPHTFNLVANYKLTRRISFSLNTTYNTGRPVTVPVAGFDFKNAQNIHFSDRNSYRIPDYFRVDFGLNLEGNHRIQKLAHAFWSLSIYNLTGRDNPFSVFFDVNDGEISGSQLIIFGDPIPTLSYNFKF